MALGMRLSALMRIGKYIRMAIPIWHLPWENFAWKQTGNNLPIWQAGACKAFPPTGNNIRWPTTTTNNPDDIFWQCGAYKASTPLGNNIRWPTTLMAFSGGLQGLHPLRATKSDGQQPRWHLTEICKTSVSLLFALIAVLIFDRHKPKSQNDIIITLFSLIIVLNF